MKSNILFAAAGLLAASTAQAATLSTEVFTLPSSRPFLSAAIDNSNGEFYLRETQSAGNYSVFSSVDAYLGGAEALRSFRSDNLGTYVAAADGELITRTPGRTSPGVQRVDGSTGDVIDVRDDIEGLGPENLVHSLGWGGDTAVNVLNSGSDLFVLSRQDVSNNFQIETLNADLSSAGSITFERDVVGFVFAIGDFVFGGDNFRSGRIDFAVDVTTGRLTEVDYDLGFETNVFISNTFYDDANDTVYFLNANGEERRLVGASGALGADLVGEVPLPAAAFLFAPLALGFLRARRG